jgi:hypothetical protein
MRLLVFLHGTVLMHAGAVDVTRAERVAQVRAKHPTVREHGWSEAMIAIVAFYVASLFISASGDCLIGYQGAVWR